MPLLHRKRGIFLVVILAILMLLIGSVYAHESREVGEYNLVFGWRSEPALVGYLNGPELFIHLPDGDSAEMMQEMDVSLQVEITFGPASTTLDLRRDFSDPSHYIADLIPTRPGDYSFRVFGTIGEAAIDEVFTSADGEFSSVEPVADVTFPDDLSSMIDLIERLEELEARLEALEGSE